MYAKVKRDIIDYNTNNQIDDSWDIRIKEYEVDSSWKNHPIYKSDRYINFRKKWSKARKGQFLSKFPLNIEVEPTYYCNLKCPFCARKASEGERQDNHMSKRVWNNIIKEVKENNLVAIQMDHEAESMMNPNFFNMLEDTKKSGCMDAWLHTNGLMLNSQNSKKLIKSGLTKLNVSIDAYKKETYEKLRVGGKFEKLLENVKTFLKVKNEMQASYLRVRVSFVEQKENFSEKKDFFNYWSKQKGINLITFQRCLDFSLFEKEDPDNKLTEKELEIKYKNQKNFFCSAPWETPVILEDGKVTPCGMPVRDCNKDFIIGDISKGDKIKDCWSGKKMNDLREKHKNNEWYKINMCRTCVKMTRNSFHKNETFKV